MTGAVTGLLLVTVAAAANATFTIPMKFARHRAWENIRLVWSFLTLLALPAAAAILFIPSLALVYREAGPGPMAIVTACGAGWGLAQVLFGLAVDSTGIGLAFSIVPGLSAAGDSLNPFLRMGREAMASPAAAGVLLGVALVLAVVAFSRAQRFSTFPSHAVIQHPSVVLRAAGSATMDRVNVR